MTDSRANLKIWPHTLPKLRLLYALTGESMVSIVDRLVEQELARVQNADRSFDKLSTSQDVQIQALSLEKE